jgi:hypothetical protein
MKMSTAMFLFLCFVQLAVAWEWFWTTDDEILITASKDGEVHRLEELVARNLAINFNQHFGGGITALIAAAYKNQSMTVQVCLAPLCGPSLLSKDN